MIRIPFSPPRPLDPEGLRRMFAELPPGAPVCLWAGIWRSGRPEVVWKVMAIQRPSAGPVAVLATTKEEARIGTCSCQLAVRVLQRFGFGWSQPDLSGLAIVLTREAR